MDLRCRFRELGDLPDEIEDDPEGIIDNTQGTVGRFGNCKSDYLMTALELTHGDYLIKIEFLTGQNFGVESLIAMGLEIQTINPTFVIFSIVVRYVLIVIVALGLHLFLSGLKTLPRDQILFEHRMLKMMSFSLILYNDPLSLINIAFPFFLT